MRIPITGGLNIALNWGAPAQEFDGASPVEHLAVMGADYRGIKPTLQVAVDDRVRLGDVLFTDRLEPRLRVTAPGAGVVVAINRGARRSLTSVVIRLEGSSAIEFSRYTSDEIDSLGTDQVQDQLLQSGLWTALRTRPFDRVPAPATKPRWLFVTAMDTNPGAINPQIAIDPYIDDWEHGLRVLTRLGAEAVYVCHGPDDAVPLPQGFAIRPVQFDGPHPAGLPGTHIHHLASPDVGTEAWHINYQDVVAIGRLFRQGELWTERSIALCGAGARRPRLLRTRLGAKISELLGNEILTGQTVLSGSALSGRIAAAHTDYLGRFHQQVCLLPPPARRRKWAFGWHPFNRSLRPSAQAIVASEPDMHPSGLLPVEAFERVWPFTSAPVPLLRALLSGDTETAEMLGCLAFAEEDLALLSAVCPAQRDYGAALRRTLDALEET